MMLNEKFIIPGDEAHIRVETTTGKEILNTVYPTPVIHELIEAFCNANCIVQVNGEIVVLC